MRVAALFGLVAAVALGGAAGASAAPLIAEYGATSIPSDAKPTDVVVGPDGNQWYTWPGRDAIARVTPSGEVEEITAGISSGAAPQSIVVGPDNNLWFTEPGHDRIARYSFSTGTVTEFGTGIPSGARPWDIVNESGALWFTENGTGQIGRSSTSGSIAQFSPPVPTGAQLWGLAVDDNGYLWFPYSTATGGAVMAMDQDGDEVCTTGPLAARYIAIGADDAAYVGDIATKGIDRIAPGCGPVSMFAASQELDISGLTLGPDNNIWFTDTAVPSVGRLRLGGGPNAAIDVFSEGLYDGSLPTGITAELLTDTLWIGDVGPLSLVGEVSLFGGIAQFGVGSLPDGAQPQQIALGNEWMYFTVLARLAPPACLDEARRRVRVHVGVVLHRGAVAIRGPGGHEHDEPLPKSRGRPRRAARHAACLGRADYSSASTGLRASSMEPCSREDTRPASSARRLTSTARNCSTSTRVVTPASSISGRNVAGAALRDVGATIAVERPSSSSAWTMTAYRGPACSRPRRLGRRMR